MFASFLPLSRRTRVRRGFAGVAATAVTAALLVTLPVDLASAADGRSLTLVKKVDPQTLAGEKIPYTLEVTNPAGSGKRIYNLSFRDQLQLGTKYVPGSSPKEFGEPTVFVDGATGQQTLVWSNVADIAESETRSLTFAVTTDDNASDISATPVGKVLSNTGEVYGQTNPRLVPKFNARGAHVDGSATDQASGAASTTLVPLEIEKSEPSPESELLRGVHAHPTQYTLEVRNTKRSETEGVVVTDFLPAALEFLGCGDVDHTADGEVEYPGAPRLTATPDVVQDCLPATAVETVQNPAGLPAGVYTKVTWNLGTMAKDEVRTIVYAAGIPQRENTMTFPGATPTPASGEQAANLDNNTGPSTREPGSESALTNTARATGTYTGARAPLVTDAASSSDEHTVTVEDVAVVKSGNVGTFAAGREIEYTLHVRVSEYVDATDVVLVDTLPDGLCPVGNTAEVNGCPATSGTPTGASYTSITEGGNGTTKLTFSALDVDANGEAKVVYRAKMREGYFGKGAPTVSGDDFLNPVALTAKTLPLTTVDSPDQIVSQDVVDASEHRLESDAPQLSKTIQPETGVTPYTCSTAGADYKHPSADESQGLDFTFSEASRVCFRIRVDFSAVNQTRNVSVTDFLPANATFETGSATYAPGSLTPATTPAVEGDTVTWELGDAAGSSGGRYVGAGAFFDVRFSAIVNGPSANRSVDITANLAKLRWDNSEGQARSLRDQVDYSIDETPAASIRKGVERVDRVAAGAPIDASETVGESETVKYTVAFTNEDDERTLHDVELWDVLPAGITCAAVSAGSVGGTCSNPGDTGHPTFSGADTLSALRWTLPTTVAPKATALVSYLVKIPADVSVSTTYTNKAAVRSYTSRSNIGTVVEHFPTSNIDTTVTTAQQDVPAASDTRSVKTAPAAVAKSVTTSIDGAGNDAGSQATIGEGVTWTVDVTVPPHTTLYQGVLDDTLPAGLEFLADQPITVQRSLDGGGSWAPLSTIPPVLGSSGGQQKFTAVLEPSLVNSTDEALITRFTVPTRVTTLPANTHGTRRTNTAELSSRTTATGGSALPTVSGSSRVTVVEPSPTLTKTNDRPTAEVAAEQVITYTLTAGNAADRPVLNDAVVVDCLPAGLELTGGAGLVAVPDGCTADNGAGTEITWNVGDLAPGTTRTATYTAMVKEAAAGAARLTNTAKLTGSTLADGANAATVERSYLASASSSLTVAQASIAKKTTTPSRTVGERAEYKVTVTLPAQVNFWDTAVTDTLPVGLDLSSLTTESVTCEDKDGASCTVDDTALTRDGRTVGWFLGDIARAAKERTVTITYSAVVNGTVAEVKAGSVLTNSALLRWNQANGADPTSVTGVGTTGAGPAVDTVTVAEPKVTIKKGVSDTTPAPGAEFTYTVTVSNGTGSSVSPAHDIRVTDVVPVGVVVDAGSISDDGTLTGATADGGGTITWHLVGPLAVGAQKALTYEATTPRTVITGGLVNTADVTEYRSLPSDHPVTPGGRRYTDVTEAKATVTPDVPKVTVTKAVGNQLAYAGRSTTWTLTATNSGGADAHHVDLTDVLPENWTYDAGSATVSVAGSSASQVEPRLTTSGDVQTLTWEDVALRLAPNRKATVVFTATPGPKALETPGVGMTVAHTNVVSVAAEDVRGDTSSRDSATGTGTPYADADASATAHIASADLAVTKSHVAPLVAGRNVTWTLEVANQGPDPAQGPFVVTDRLPEHTTFVSASGTGWSISHANGTVTAQRTGSLAAGAKLPQISVVTAVDAALRSGDEVANTAEVTASTHDPKTSNNTDTHTVAVQAISDLGITKELVGDGTLVAGSPATWRITVTNHGPTVNRGTTSVTDMVPSGVSGATASGDGFTCATVDGDLVCETEDAIAVGASKTLDVTGTVTADRLAVVTNTAKVKGQHDDNPANDEAGVTTTPGTSADVAISKRQVTTKLVPGKEVRYEISVHNAGPSVARGVTLTDELAADLEPTGATTSAGSCAIVGQLVTCALGDLEAGGDVTVTVVGELSPDFTGVLTNTADVTSTTPDPVPTNNTSTVTSDAADKEVDLSLAKRHVDASDVVSGTRTSFELVVTNEGPSRSTGDVTVVDVLPAGMSFVSGSGSGWTVTERDGVVTATTSAQVPRGGKLPAITVVVAVAPDAGPATLTNTAVVSGTEFDPDLDNNDDRADVDVVDEVNVLVTKTVDGSRSVVAGAERAFVLTVTNDSSSDADDVTVVDAMPAGMTLVEASGRGWDCDTTPGTCTREVLAAGASSEIRVVALVGSGVPDGTVLTNVATVTTSSPGDDPADNRDEAEVQAVAVADLAVVKTHSGGPAVAGSTTTFDIAVTNHGDSDAVGPVEVADVLPAGMTFVSASSAAGVWTCDGSDVENPVCELPGGLVAGTTAPVLTLTVAVAADQRAGIYTNVVSVSSPTTDRDPANDSDDADAEVVREADLTITKEHVGKGLVGEEVEFTLRVSNAGPSTATGVVVTDAMPKGMTLVSVAGADASSDWTCAATSKGDARCEFIGEMAVGEQAEPIVVRAAVDAKAFPAVTNVAVVDGDERDPRPKDNTSSDEVEVPAKVDLSIVKKHKGKFTVGKNGRYKFVVRNAGPTADPGPITVTDVLPKGLSYVSVDGAEVTCSADGRRVTCTIPGLEAGEKRSFVMTVAIGAKAFPSVTNTGTVGSPSTDVDPGDNASVDVVTVIDGHVASSGSDGAGGDGDGSGGDSAGGGGGDGFLPDTGGPALWLVLLAALLTAGGVVLRRRSRRV